MDCRLNTSLLVSHVSALFFELVGPPWLGLRSKLNSWDGFVSCVCDDPGECASKGF